MRRRKQATPAGEIVLAAIKRILERGETPTLGLLVRTLGKSRSAVAASLLRLERAGWIKRGKYRQGLPRAIQLRRDK